MNTHHQNLVYLLALSKIPFVGPASCKSLIQHYGSPQQLFHADFDELKMLGKQGSTIARAIYQSNLLLEAENEIKQHINEGVDIISIADQRYPMLLKECTDAPLILYVKGNLEFSKSLAIVGTRSISYYGEKWIGQNMSGLKTNGLAIVSGLALGVDGKAHQEALDNGIKTIGVLAHGFNTIYPKKHHHLADQIVKQGGALLSEHSFFMHPDRENFPRRNRIIAGMSQATLVVESRKTGGSIITAKMANHYNRDVFAVPGNVDIPNSYGPNWLIKSNRANMVETADDIIRHMMWDVEEKAPVQTAIFPSLEPAEVALVQGFVKGEKRRIDEISETANLSVGELSLHLLQLELKGVLKSHPGKYYSLV